MDCSRWIHLIFSALLALWGVVSVSVGVADLGDFAYGASEMFYRASIHAFDERSFRIFFVFKTGKNDKYSKYIQNFRSNLIFFQI